MPTNTNHLKVFCDGGSRGNPGPAACAFVIYINNNLLFESGIFLGTATNNQAEYFGVIKSLEWLRSHPKSLSGISHMVYQLDSLLVVNQLKGLYKIKDPHLQVFVRKIHGYLSELKNIGISFVHIPRSNNSRADFLVNQTLDSSTLHK